MKATLLFAAMMTVFSATKVLATTELEALRETCARQELEIRRLSALSQTQPTTKKATLAPATQSSAHTVRKGESLERIARRHGISVATLVKLNGIKSSSIIHPGQRLKLPATAAPKANQAVAASTPKPSTKTVVRSSQASSHTVAPGDTFSSISRKHRLSVNALMAANPDVEPTRLRPGQTIRLHGSSPTPKPSIQTVAARPAPTPKPITQPQAPSRPAFTPSQSIPVSNIPAEQAVPAVSIETAALSTPASTPPPSAPPAAAPEAPSESQAPQSTERKIRAVTIEGEMTYGEFAAKHGSDPERLNDLNGLDLTHATVLAKGSELYVPAQP